MRIGIFAVGKLKQGPERELCARYVERAKLSGKPLGLPAIDPVPVYACKVDADVVYVDVENPLNPDLEY